MTQCLLYLCYYNYLLVLLQLNPLLINPYYFTNANPCLFLCLSLVHTRHQSLLLQLSSPLWWLLPSLLFQYDWPTFSYSVLHLPTSSLEGLHYDTVLKMMCLVPRRCVCKCASRSFRIIKEVVLFSLYFSIVLFKYVQKI